LKTEISLFTSFQTSFDSFGIAQIKASVSPGQDQMFFSKRLAIAIANRGLKWFHKITK